MIGTSFEFELYCCTLLSVYCTKIKATDMDKTEKLLDYDWDMGLVMSSDQMSRMYSKMMRLNMSVIKNESVAKICLEMNPEELDILINEMENFVNKEEL